MVYFGRISCQCVGNSGAYSQRKIGIRFKMMQYGTFYSLYIVVRNLLPENFGKHNSKECILVALQVNVY